MINQIEAIKVLELVQRNCGKTDFQSLMLIGASKPFSSHNRQTLYVYGDSGPMLKVTIADLEIQRRWCEATDFHLSSQVEYGLNSVEHPRLRRSVARLQKMFFDSSRIFDYAKPTGNRRPSYWLMIAEGDRLVFESAARIGRSRLKICACSRAIKATDWSSTREGFGGDDTIRLSLFNSEKNSKRIHISPSSTPFDVDHDNPLEIRMAGERGDSEVSIQIHEMSTEVNVSHGSEFFVLQKHKSVYHWLPNHDQLSREHHT